MTLSLGIDFGTSNSTVGFQSEQGPRLIALEDTKPTLPSALFYDVESRSFLFGREAIRAYIDGYDGRLLRALKSVLGTSLMEESTQFGATRQPFKSLLATYLSHLKTKAETALGAEAATAVLGRPVFFADNNAEADALAQTQLEEAARAAGFQHIAFQYEPIAAAFSHERSITREELTLVADLGGGTSDFSILRLSPSRNNARDRRSDVLANAGIHIGGTDFDSALSLAKVMPLLGLGTLQKGQKRLPLPSHYFHELATWHRIPFLYDRKNLSKLKELERLAAEPERVQRLLDVVHQRNGHRLAGDVEAAKITLSNHDEATLLLSHIEQSLALNISRHDLAAAAQQLTRKIASTLKNCLVQAQLKASQIDTLFLTGGTATIPFVSAALKAGLPNAALVHGDPFGSVGIGLAIEAGKIFNPVRAASM